MSKKFYSENYPGRNSVKIVKAYFIKHNAEISNSDILIFIKTIVKNTCYIYSKHFGLKKLIAKLLKTFNFTMVLLPIYLNA